MPAQENPTLRTAYAEKVAVDLAANKAEQDFVRSEIERLTAQLATLKADHVLLESVSGALAGTSAASASRRSRKTSADAPPTRKTASRKPRVLGPPLTELVYEHLSRQSEPRTAREITQGLAEAYPDRKSSDNLVRTTTERLVARSRVERSKQGSTVYYSVANAGSVPDPASEPPAAEDGAPTS
ncbi:hypothetical protein [Streptomyces zaomyceticus]|uniref:hypothetical protein n=1 Tax=Streptomyces zaomyceticus TaxID=68286 RepID=UPI0036C8780D